MLALAAVLLVVAIAVLHGATITTTSAEAGGSGNGWRSGQVDDGHRVIAWWWSRGGACHSNVCLNGGTCFLNSVRSQPPPQEQRGSGDRGGLRRANPNGLFSGTGSGRRKKAEAKDEEGNKHEEQENTAAAEFECLCPDGFTGDLCETETAQRQPKPHRTTTTATKTTAKTPRDDAATAITDDGNGNGRTTRICPEGKGNECAGGDKTTTPPPTRASSGTGAGCAASAKTTADGRCQNGGECISVVAAAGAANSRSFCICPSPFIGRYTILFYCILFTYKKLPIWQR